MCAFISSNPDLSDFGLEKMSERYLTLLEKNLDSVHMVTLYHHHQASQDLNFNLKDLESFLVAVRTMLNRIAREKKSRQLRNDTDPGYGY